jgi:hypothetical protein
VPLNYRNTTVSSRRRLHPEKLIVAQITNKLLTAHQNQRIGFVFTSCHDLQVAPLLRYVLILSGHLVYFTLSFLFRVSEQNSVHSSHLCPAPPISLQSKRPNCSLCSSAGTPATSLKFPAPSVCATPRRAAHSTNTVSLKMESADTSETSVHIYQIIQRQISENGQFEVIRIRISEESTTENTFRLKAILNCSEGLFLFRIRLYAAKCTTYLLTN